LQCHGRIKNSEGIRHGEMVITCIKSRITYIREVHSVPYTSEGKTLFFPFALRVIHKIRNMNFQILHHLFEFEGRYMSGGA
jgi:hypothetical protein